jgi:hypothetical protein
VSDVKDSDKLYQIFIVSFYAPAAAHSKLSTAPSLKKAESDVYSALGKAAVAAASTVTIMIVVLIKNA